MIGFLIGSAVGVAYMVFLALVVGQISRRAWRTGVIHGHMATVLPGEPTYRDARKVIDELEAAVLERTIDAD